MPWKCSDCGGTHEGATAPQRCSCGGTGFEFVSQRDQRRPDPMEPSEQRTARHAAASGSPTHSGPDLNPDGSLTSTTERPEPQSDSSTREKVSDHARAWGEIGRVRGGSYLNDIGRLAGLVVVLVAAYNLLVTRVVLDLDPVFTQYRVIGPIVQTGSNPAPSIIYVGDVVLFAIGLAVMYWFTR